MRHSLYILGILILTISNGYSQTDQDSIKTIKLVPDIAKFPPLYVIDGLCLLNSKSISDINQETIRKVKIIKAIDTIFDPDNKAKFVGCIDIKTKRKINPGLKYIKKISNNWLESHPFSVIIINDKKLMDDLTRYCELSEMKKEEIIEIKTSEEGTGTLIIKKMRLTTSKAP